MSPRRCNQGRYWVVLLRHHPRANKNGHVHEHVLIAEHALGKPLSGEHPVHHHDNDGHNNANTNLVICEDDDYHKLIHARLRVFLSGGDPDADSVCSVCHEAKPVAEFYSDKNAWNGAFSSCIKCTVARDKVNQKNRTERARLKRAELMEVAS